MTITITPFTVGPIYNLRAPLVGDMKEKIKMNCLPTTYLGISLDDKQVSFVSSRELAEKTKLWMEKWLKDKP